MTYLHAGHISDDYVKHIERRVQVPFSSGSWHGGAIEGRPDRVHGRHPKRPHSCRYIGSVLVIYDIG